MYTNIYNISISTRPPLVQVKGTSFNISHYHTAFPLKKMAEKQNEKKQTNYAVQSGERKVEIERWRE